MPESPTLLQQVWTEADACYNQLVEMLKDNQVEPGRHHEPELDQLKGRLRGLCFTLRLWMTPHFDTEDAVAREVVKRYQMTEAGEEYETIGLGSRRLEMPPAVREASRQARDIPAPAAGNVGALLKKLGADKVNKIKRSDFPVADLAEIFGVSAADVELIKRSG